jgi:transketolase
MWEICINDAQEEMRSTFVKSLQSIMDRDGRIIAIEADLGGASGFSKIGLSHKAQYINVGIAEANMMGIAAGLSMAGYIPFVHSFSPFAIRKGYDQIYISCGYSGNTINIYGSDPGVCAGVNGGTHTTFEDIALIRAIPGVMIFDPADSVQLRWIINKVPQLPGVHYIRTNRKALPCIYKEGSTFEIGKGNVIKRGKDVLLISMGETLFSAYEAALELEGQGISVEVIDMFMVKPLDAELVMTESEGKKLIVTYENHSIIGGLGSAVAELLAQQNMGIPFKIIGVNDSFGQVGTVDYLKRVYGLTKENVEEIIKEELKRCTDNYADINRNFLFEEYLAKSI